MFVRILPVSRQSIIHLAPRILPGLYYHTSGPQDFAWPPRVPRQFPRLECHLRAHVSVTNVTYIDSDPITSDAYVGVVLSILSHGQLHSIVYSTFTYHKA